MGFICLLVFFAVFVLTLLCVYFKERILNMVLDKDPDVAVEAVRLLLIIKQ